MIKIREISLKMTKIRRFCHSAKNKFSLSLFIPQKNNRGISIKQWTFVFFIAFLHLFNYFLIIFATSIENTNKIPLNAMKKHNFMIYLTGPYFSKNHLIPPDTLFFYGRIFPSRTAKRTYFAGWELRRPLSPCNWRMWCRGCSRSEFARRRK